MKVDKDTLIIGSYVRWYSVSGLWIKNSRCTCNIQGVPVWNGLTNEFHPTQLLADLLTITEHQAKPLSETVFAFPW